MDNAMKTHFHECTNRSTRLQNLADALPALGIVAAVLGVVKTMGSIDKPPSVLGGMIGSALVGTFLGVLLAYGIVAPMAGRLKQVIEQDEQIFHAVKQVVIASLHGWPQPLVVESARSGLGHDFRPGLSELLDATAGPLPWPLESAARTSRPRRPSSSRRSPWSPAAITAAPGRWPMPISSPR
jgi:chemotaxis protein MotA